MPALKATLLSGSEVVARVRVTKLTEGALGPVPREERWRGSFLVPPGAPAIRPQDSPQLINQTYRLELEDGRSGDVRVEEAETVESGAQQVSFCGIGDLAS